MFSINIVFHIKTNKTYIMLIVAKGRVFSIYVLNKEKKKKDFVKKLTYFFFYQEKLATLVLTGLKNKNKKTYLIYNILYIIHSLVRVRDFGETFSKKFTPHAITSWAYLICSRVLTTCYRDQSQSVRRVTGL